MIITICILILAYTLLGKPVGKLLDHLKDVDWKGLADKTLDSIKIFSIKSGRTASRYLLTFYYVMTNENTSTATKALIYGAIIYIVSPVDLLSRSILGAFGILDDAAVAVVIYKKIKDKVTPEIEAKVNETIVKWFGYVTQTDAEVDAVIV